MICCILELILFCVVHRIFHGFSRFFHGVLLDFSMVLLDFSMFFLDFPWFYSIVPWFYSIFCMVCIDFYICFYRFSMVPIGFSNHHIYYILHYIILY